MIEYVLEGVNCYLKICHIKIFEDEFKRPTYAEAWLSVQSGNFSGATAFNIDARLLGLFSVQLKKMYDTLKGSALFGEIDDSILIEIKASSLGHFKVSGTIHDSYPPKNLLEFKFDIDQTMIKDFASKMYKDFAHLAK